MRVLITTLFALVGSTAAFSPIVTKNAHLSSLNMNAPKHDVKAGHDVRSAAPVEIDPEECKCLFAILLWYRSSQSFKLYTILKLMHNIMYL